MADISTELEKSIAALKRILAASATSEVAGMIHAMRMRFVGPKESIPPMALKLESPARQQSFLMGLLLATKEPEEPIEFGIAAWDECVKLLNKAFGGYKTLFIPDQPGRQSEEWWRVREVAGPVFLHYFNTSLIATVEQITERIRAYCVPFDKELEQAIGISASDSLAIIKSIIEAMENDTHMMGELQAEMDGEIERFFESGDFMRRDDPDYPEFMREHYPASDAYASRFYRQGQVARSDIQAAFPRQVEAFWSCYVVSRGQGSPLDYPTQESVFDYKPLIDHHDGYAGCPSVNNLFEAVLRTCEKALSTGSSRERFFKRRDKVLEQKGEEQFGRLMGNEGQIFSTVYETADAHNEHDTVLVVANTVVIVEAKASPPVEPSRTPERAFERLRQSFRKDTGIQKGFEQGARIQRRLAAGETVPLYTDKGKLLITLDPQVHTECFCICLTRDDFGHLATNLSLLLEKDSAEPYPWAINIWDLETLVDGWEYLGWGFDKLKEYLRQRQQVQGRVLGSDELEFVGAFIQHGSLDFALEPGIDFVQLIPDYSDFFDELHDHLRYGGPAPKRKVTKPVMMNMRESIMAGRPIFLGEQSRRAPPSKPGRNGGAGAKYKKCHGR